ncbi:MAG: hypothetical protein E4H07_04575 [Nitrosomonadales bacterium]|jgi:hypothetical protein|nr:MAG: hypothetical protein E4H07_04575 [Nitrosomonadales bacterium]
MQAPIWFNYALTICLAPWARIELATYPLGDGPPDGGPIGNHINIQHLCVGVGVGVALSIY